MKDYYNILNIDINASEEQIYDAYRDKISQFNHLPFHTPKMISDIKLLKEALYVLSDPTRRYKYDNKMMKMAKYNTEDKDFDNTQICNRLFSITF